MPKIIPVRIASAIGVMKGRDVAGKLRGLGLGYEENMDTERMIAFIFHV